MRFNRKAARASFKRYVPRAKQRGSFGTVLMGVLTVVLAIVALGTWLSSPASLPTFDLSLPQAPTATLAPGGLPTFQPHTQVEAQAVIAVVNNLLGTMQELDAADEEQAAGLRENVQIQAEEGTTADLDAALEVLLGLNVDRQRQALLRHDVLAAMRRLEGMLPALPLNASSTDEMISNTGG